MSPACLFWINYTLIYFNLYFLRIISGAEMNACNHLLRPLWILENNANARVAVITDCDELDKQIKRVFEDVGEEIHRTSSGTNVSDSLGAQLKTFARRHQLCLAHLLRELTRESGNYYATAMYPQHRYFSGLLLTLSGERTLICHNQVAPAKTALFWLPSVLIV